MISETFERAWRRLARAFGAYQDVPRDPDDLDSIADARFELEDARDEARHARENETAAPSPAPERPVSKVDVSPEDQARLNVSAKGSPGEG